jgi:iron complex transport system permease protein
MQGLFRNPLADPGIVGISSGAALAAATWIVFGAGAAAFLPPLIAGFGLPLAAFLGGLFMTAALHAIATSGGRTSVLTLLLAGIALGGLTTAGIGFLVFVASDQQLREFTFWTMGSLGGATWPKIGLVLPFALLLVAFAPGLARALDALSLGEAGAFHAGVDVERLKRLAIVGVAAAVGASVAVSGVVAFFGLAVPHLVRLVLGPAHRILLQVSAIAGAAILVLADLIARHDGRTSMLTLILAGIAIAALTSAGTGFLVFIASDQQLREFTFWTLGSLGGSTWNKVLMALPFAGIFVLLAPGAARGLDAIALGEAEAFPQRATALRRWLRSSGGGFGAPSTGRRT